jgi:hypothetical protein
MMRMGLNVVGLGTLTVMELGTPSRTKTSAKDPFDQLTIDVSVSPDTLETADRLEMHHLQHEAPLQPVSPVESPPDVTALVPRNSSAVELGANNKKDVVRKLKPKPKDTDLTNLGLTAQTPTKLQRLNDQRRSSRSSRVVQMRLIACSKH